MRADWVTIGVIVLVGLTLVVTLLAVFLVWRDGYVRGWRAARCKPPTCPDCGYRLTGLSQCRCPECGASYTLDQLWKAAIIDKDRNSDRNSANGPPKRVAVHQSR